MSEEKLNKHEIEIQVNREKIENVNENIRKDINIWIKNFDNDLKDFNKQIKELEQKIDSMKIQADGLYTIYHKHFINIDNKLATLSAVIELHTQHLLNNDYMLMSLKAVIKKVIPILRGGLFISGEKEKYLLKKLDGTSTPKGATDGEPSEYNWETPKKCLKCRAFNLEKYYNGCEDDYYGKPLRCKEKEEQEAFPCKGCDYNEKEDCTEGCMKLKYEEQEAEPKSEYPNGFRAGVIQTEERLIAEFLETIKQELAYIETINFYSGNVHCISIKTLKEQFGHIIKEYEGRRKE